MGSPTQRQLQDALANLQRQNQELRDQNSALKRDHATNWRMLYDNMKNYPSTKYGDTRVLRTAVMRDISVFSLSNLVPMLTEAPNSIKDGLDALNRLFDEHRDTFALNLREGPRRRFYALRLRAGGRLAQWLDTVYVDQNTINWSNVERQLRNLKWSEAGDAIVCAPAGSNKRTGQASSQGANKKKKA